jgi:tetratricopeptide (TPR) repeat protein
MKTAFKSTILLCALAAASLAPAADNAPGMLAAGRVDDAINTLQGEIRSSPQDAKLQNLLCRAYFSLEDWDRGIAACEQAVSLDPNNATYHMWLGRIYGEKADASSFLSAAGLAKKVRNEFERAVQLSPDNAEARTDLAEFYLEAPGIVGGGRDKAEAQSQILARSAPARAHWVNARIAEKKKDPATAEREYRAAVEATHGSALAWFNLALFYRHTQRWDEMEQTITKATQAQIDHPEVLMESGEILIRSGRNYPAATQLLRRYLASGEFVEQAPAFKAHYLLGSALEKQGDKQGAAREYQAALSLAKGFGRAKEALARVNR